MDFPRNAGSRKRKCEDVSEGNRPRKMRRFDDSDLLAQLNITDADITLYSFADGEEVSSKENSIIGSANEINSDLFQFFRENVNEEVNCNIINDNSITSRDAEDGNGAAILARPEQNTYLANNGIFEEINTEDNQIQNNLQTSTISNINMQSEISDDFSTFGEITMADNVDTLPKILSFTISEEDDYFTSTNHTNILNLNFERKCSLVSTELNMDRTLLGENEECCVNKDHQVLNNTQEISDIFSGFPLFEASSTTTQSINDKSPTKWYKCAPFSETEFENANMDQKFLDYRSTNVETLASENEIFNQVKMTEIEEQIPISSKCDTMSMALDDNCSAIKFPKNSHLDNLTHQESHIPDFGDRDSNLIASEMQLTEIKLQNNPEHIIEANKEGSVIFKNKDQSHDKHFDAAYDMDYMDINVGPVAGENEVSNKNKIRRNKGQISDSSRYETILMSSGDFSSAKIPSNTDAIAQQQLQNNFILKEKSAEATKLQVVLDELIEANEEVLVRSVNKDKSKDKRSIGIKKRIAILKERALEEESRIILDLIQEYIEITNLEEFTSSDIIDFVTTRMSNVTSFKMLHTVRIFIVNNLKSAVLKKSGQRYRLGCRSSDAFVANIS